MKNALRNGKQMTGPPSSESPFCPLHSFRDWRLILRRGSEGNPKGPPLAAVKMLVCVCVCSCVPMISSRGTTSAALPSHVLSNFVSLSLGFSLACSSVMWLGWLPSGSRDLPVSASPALGFTRICYHAWLFTSVLEIYAEALMLARQARHRKRYLPAPTQKLLWFPQPAWHWSPGIPLEALTFVEGQEESGKLYNPGRPSWPFVLFYINEHREMKSVSERGGAEHWRRSRSPEMTKAVNTSRVLETYPSARKTHEVELEPSFFG